MLRRFVLAALLLAPLAALSAAKNIEVTIKGMHCASCTKAVEENLAKIPGIDKASVKVLLKEKKATVQAANADAPTLEAIKKAVADAGFSVEGEPKIN